jgi:hypothetical protein
VINNVSSGEETDELNAEDEIATGNETEVVWLEVLLAYGAVLPPNCEETAPVDVGETVSVWNRVSSAVIVSSSSSVEDDGDSDRGKVTVVIIKVVRVLVMVVL